MAISPSPFKSQAGKGAQDAPGDPGQVGHRYFFGDPSGIPDFPDRGPGGMSWNDIANSYDWNGRFNDYLQGYIGMVGTPGFLQGPTQIQTTFDPQGYPYAVPTNPAFATGYGNPQRRSMDYPSVETKAGGGVTGPAYKTLDNIAKDHTDTPKNSDIVIPKRFQDGGVAEELTAPSEIHEVPGVPLRPRTYYRNMYEGGDVYSLPEYYYPVRQFNPRGMFTPTGKADFMAQYGGVATDENDNPASYQPSRGWNTGRQAMAEDNAYQGGGMIDTSNWPQLRAIDMSRNPIDPRQRALMYQQAMRAVRPQLMQPIYTAQMLATPPPRISGYAGELAYQDGGVTDDDKDKKVIKPQPGAGGADYLYVDPRAAAYGPQGYNPMEGSAARVPISVSGGYQALTPEQLARNQQIANMPKEAQKDYFDRLLGTGKYAPTKQNTEGITNEDLTKILGFLPKEEAPVTYDNQPTFSFQGGGVARSMLAASLLGTDESGNPTLPSMAGTQQQQPQRQASPVAGEPARKQPARKQPQKYEFGPADYFYSSPALQKLMQQQTPTLQQGMKKGGVIPKEFMQYLANGGLVKEFTPDHHLMFSLGMKYALSPKQAAKRLKNSANQMPP